MKDYGIGDVIVLDGGQLRGIVTDRDLAVRVLGDGRDPQTTTLGEVCSLSVVTVSPDDEVAEAVSLIRQKAVRRLPVVDGRTPVGIVSIGDPSRSSATSGLHSHTFPRPCPTPEACASVFADADELL